MPKHTLVEARCDLNMQSEFCCFFSRLLSFCGFHRLCVLVCVVCIGRWSCVRVSFALGDGDAFVCAVFGGDGAVCVVFVCDSNVFTHRRICKFVQTPSKLRL